MLRFETAGESHGECLVATLTGLPAGVPVSLDTVNHELWRRQQGYGRGGRMKIEHDRAEIVSGVRHSHTIGSPVPIPISARGLLHTRHGYKGPGLPDGAAHSNLELDPGPGRSIAPQLLHS